MAIGNFTSAGGSGMTGAGGGQQLIGGKSYVIGTPEWQRAMQEDKVSQAQVEGTATGTGKAAEISAVSPALQGILNTIGGSGGNFSGGAFGSGGGGGNLLGDTPPPSGPAALAPVDTSAATSAAFGAAKDQVGQETAGALTGLRSALAGRGLLGSGSESTGTRNVIMKGQQELGDTSRQNAITQSNVAQKEAETSFQGAVTQRGQDIQREQNIMQARNQQAQLQLQQRAQSLQALQAALGSTMQAY